MRHLLAAIFKVNRFDFTANGIDMFQDLLVRRMSGVPFNGSQVIER
jgi:hypothetical protein